MTDEEKIKRDIEESQHTTLPCSLCHVETYGRGVYTADQKGTMGAPADMYRIIIYPLCQNCSYTPGYKDQIKRKVLSEFN
jgi:hypothetical protein